mmetsp:Transcript_115219/g.366228  ORF Transcript_115219/g.366228 Transcript_115219/m.366228 type:complete len:623 (-) Transcript_115219:195-2063(-)
MACELHFAVDADAREGDEVRLVGALPQFGSWNPPHGVVMKSVPESPLFTCGALCVPRSVLDGDAEEALEFKFVILRRGGGVRWEAGPNRRLAAVSSGWVVARFGSTACAPLHNGPERPLHSPGAVLLFRAICADTLPGETLQVVGSCPSLGAWDPVRGVTLSTSPERFPEWRGTVRLDAIADGAIDFYWKLAICRAGGEVEWEQGADRSTALGLEHGGLEVRILSALFGASPASTGAPCRLRLHASPAPRLLGGMGRGEAPGKALRPLAVLRAADVAKASLGLQESPTAEFMPRSLSFMSSCSTHADNDSRFASSPRDDVEQFTQSWLWGGAHKVAKEEGKCEDAYFVGRSCMGVADGVGSMSQWAHCGVNAGAYAAELMAIASTELQASAEAWHSSPTQGAGAAVAAVAAAEKGASTYGASTIAVAQLQGRVLDVANLGDSCFMVVRKDRVLNSMEVVFRSTSQQHKWNFPYQLLRVPPCLHVRMPKGSNPDTAADCDQYRLQVFPGDLILMFTDGVTDNLHEHEILDVIQRVCKDVDCDSSRSGMPEPSLIARTIAAVALKRSRDAVADTPFSQEALVHGINHFLGGKVDDITAVAAWVLPVTTINASTSSQVDELSPRP